MIDQNCSKPFKEAICIDAMRIFDSCSSQDCLEDLEFCFDEKAQCVINGASYIKSKCIEVSSVNFTVDPVPFNKGFYTVDVTYNFRAEVEAYTTDKVPPVVVFGTAAFSKKVILFGSDGSTKKFVSNDSYVPSSPAPVSGCAACCDNGSLPVASVSVAPPMCLDAKLCNACSPTADKKVKITIGIFAIVSLSRPVSVMIPAYDYCLPERECSTNTDTPCELFEKICFPTSEFFPKSLDDHCEKPGCNCPPPHHPHPHTEEAEDEDNS